MSHKIEINDKTYEDLKEFCTLNNLKIGQFADKLIRDGLMIEMYGDVPFTNYRKPEQKPMVEIPIKEIEVEEHITEPVQYDITEVVDNEEDKQPGIEETLKGSGVPDKVVNKITRRRLK